MGGGLDAFIDIFDRDAVEVNVAYFSIRRSQQMENLQQYDRNDWPSPAELEGYIGKIHDDPNYYEPVDYFFELEAWLTDRNVVRRKQMEEQKKNPGGTKMPSGREAVDVLSQRR